MKNMNFKHTIRACFTGYIVQAIVNNFVPLLFIHFNTVYNIPLSQITLLVTFNFGIQLLVDFISAGFIDKIGYRVSSVLAHLCSSAGFVALVVLPDMIEPFYGLLVAVTIYAVGGGLLEVLVSPIVEACPTDNKQSVMSLLHSFYCWGHVGVVCISTVFFGLFGIGNWKILALLWAIIPLVNAFVFSKVPIYTLVSHEEKGMTFKELVSNKVFWILVIMMSCAGASEQAVSQWSSAFAEAGLGVSKVIGDLAGPMFFAVMMGISRTLYSKFADKIKLEKFMAACTLLCVLSYLLISLSPIPVLSLIGCGICGFSVGIMWPGTFSIASGKMKYGGTMLFAFLALAGDLGCGGGPTYVGGFASIFNGSLGRGILMASIFPLLMLIGLMLMKKVQGADILSNRETKFH